MILVRRMTGLTALFTLFCLVPMMATNVSNIHAAAQAKDSSVFEVYKDKGGKYRFRMKSSEGKNLINSGKGYNDSKDVMSVVQFIQKNAAKATVVDEEKAKKSTPPMFAIYMDKGGKFRFRFLDKDSKSYGGAVTGYKTMNDVQTVIETIRKTAMSAKIEQSK